MIGGKARPAWRSGKRGPRAGRAGQSKGNAKGSGGRERERLLVCKQRGGRRVRAKRPLRNAIASFRADNAARINKFETLTAISTCNLPSISTSAERKKKHDLLLEPHFPDLRYGRLWPVWTSGLCATATARGPRSGLNSVHAEKFRMVTASRNERITNSCQALAGSVYQHSLLFGFESVSASGTEHRASLRLLL